MTTKTAASNNATKFREADFQAPGAAFRFESGPLKFGALTEPNVYPVAISVRSAEPIEHWYWGRIIHDMAGYRLGKPAVPLDYCHDEDEIVGVAENFVADEATGLSATGRLISVDDQDRAAELIKKGPAGIPYEASLDWSAPARLEFIDAGISVVVNGRDFAGPGYVVREWSARSVAVCPYGADSNTATKFAGVEKPVGCKLFTKGGQIKMPKETKLTATEATPEIVPTAETITPPAVPTPAVKPVAQTATSFADFQSQLKRFTETFGAEGATMFADGLSFEAGAVSTIKSLRDQLAAKDEELAKFAQKLASVPRGEVEPITGGEFSGEPKTKFAKSNLDRIAAGIKIPGKK